jgi:phage gpG-like protein
MRPSRSDFPTFKAEAGELTRLMRSLPRIIGVAARNFYMDSFRRQGYIDNSYSRWQPRKAVGKKRSSRSDGRALLVNSGALRRSLRIVTNPSSVIIESNLPYAEVHNEGGTISGNVGVKAHARSTKKGQTTVKAHSRNVNFKMPKRFGLNGFFLVSILSLIMLMKELLDFANHFTKRVWNWCI